MRHVFSANASYDDGRVQMYFDPFECESTDEVIARVSNLIDSDNDIQIATRFTLETEYECKDDPKFIGIDYVYEIKRRNRTLLDEKDKMLKELRKELDRLVFGRKTGRKTTKMK